MRRFLPFIIVLAIAVSTITAADNYSLSVTPGALIPMGTSSDDFGIGGGAELSFAYRMPFARVLYGGAGIGYFLTPQTIVDLGVSLLSFDLKAGLNWVPATRLAFRAFGGVGWGQGIVQDGQGSGGSLFWRAGAGFDFGLNPSWKLGLDADYRQYVSTPAPLWQGVFVGLTLRYKLGQTASQPRLKINNIELMDVYPVLYGYYENNPLGSLTLVNGESGEIENARVDLYVKRYMDEPVTGAIQPEMVKGEELSVPIYALFSDQVMGITEGDKAAASIKVTYLYQGREMVVELTESINFQNRNAISWDDDRKAAAFVTAKDPAVLRFSKGITGDIREAANRATSRNYRIALGLFQGLSTMGIDYVVDPQSSYANFSENSFAVDYLQFPGQTMAYKGGDCDDLTILYSALLESVGIETAMITVPGHIYVAFALEVTSEEALRLFPGDGEVIIKDDKAWVPVEVTMVRDGFQKAWKEAARDWTMNNDAGKASFLPVRESWNLYPPVGGSDISGDQIEYPSDTVIMASYDREIEAVVRLQISSREEELKRNIEISNGSPKHLNRLGLLYARYGLSSEAREYFMKAAEQDYVPSLVNIGNLEYLEGDYSRAETSFQAALNEESDNPKALLGLARSQYENQNYQGARRTFEFLALENPALAERYVFLSGDSGGTTRASDDGYRQIAEWDEE